MNSTTPWLAHAEAMLDKRNLAAALSCFELAERKGADPDRCAAGRWMASMLQGNFEEAWRQSDAIRHRGAPDPHRYWNGESVRAKRVMVRCLHGFGDAVQFLRYIPALRRIAAQVTVEVPPRLLELARVIHGVDEVITWGEAAPAVPPQWDVQVEVTELPYFFRTRLRDLPVIENYIRIPWNVAHATARAFGRDDRTRVGVVWSAGEWDPTRSMPLREVQQFMHGADFAFWNLQGGSVRKQWSDLEPASNLRDAPAFCADCGILPLAAFISQLDLVITVDTLAAHLAGALARPTWLMLQHAGDWRWMVDREDSPWYPSMRIFRQAEQGNWGSVSQQVQHAFAEWHDSLHRRIAA